jgi:hypothetical protein
VAIILGALGTAPCEALAAHVDDASKRALCEALAAVVRKGSKRTQFRKNGKLPTFEMEALDSITPWCEHNPRLGKRLERVENAKKMLKDPYFVARLLDGAPDALGNVLGGLVTSVRGGVALDLEHAATVMHVANNCAINLAQTHLAAGDRRATTPSLAPLLTSGLFRAAMHVCGAFNHPTVAEPAATLLRMLGRDVTAARKLLVPGKPARAALDEALENAQKPGGSALVWKHLSGLAQLANTFAEISAGGAGSASTSGGGGGGGSRDAAIIGVCRVCGKNERVLCAKVTKCGGCLKVFCGAVQVDFS